MEDSEKLNVLMDELTKVFHLTNDFASLVRENIQTRADYYKNIDIDFSNEIQYVKNSTTSMDFFINRTIHNIRHYEYNNVYNPYNLNNMNQEEYKSETQSLRLSSSKAIGDIAIKKLKNRLDEIPEELANQVNKKIIAHEFGHAFQTSFSGCVGKNDTKYKELVSNLNSKYPDTFIIPKYEGELKVYQNGLIPALIDDGKDRIREYYSNKDQIILLDDIFNEDEALRLCNVTEPQDIYGFGHDCYKNIYNYESTNYKITSYARMMKYILGDNKAFRVLYQNGIEFFEFFDQFEKISTDIFKNGVESKKPVVSCILDCLERIKNYNSLGDALNLDLFFSKCLEKRVKFLIKLGVDDDELAKCKLIANDFIRITTRSLGDKQNHHFVIENIKAMLRKY